ncbi:MAG: type II secretion system GspH family protein [Victivallaceae bacterium]|nr:type II secretion system GspH family protein [Victivallaceae bacterium]
MKMRRIRCFTLVELIVSMAVFALMGMMVTQLFSASQKLWVSTSRKSQGAAEARMALDFLTELITASSSVPPVWTPDKKASDGSADVKDYSGGSDLFEIQGGGASPSELFFATKTDHKALKTSDDEVASFVGVKIADVSDSAANDPDAGSSVLQVTLLNTGTTYEDQFPENDANVLCGNSGVVNPGSTANFSTDSSNSVRIASNVVDFQVRAYQTAADVQGSITAGHAQWPQADPGLPAAVSITLVLMDRENFLDYKNASDNAAKNRLRDAYARTYRRIIWLDEQRNRDLVTNYY